MGKPEKLTLMGKRQQATTQKRTFRGATLTPAQRRIADRVTGGAERYYVWNAGRQVGKSFTAVQLLLWFSLNHANTVSMYVSMTYSQTLKLFNELYKGVKNSGVVALVSRSNFEIEFINGSQILFRSYQNPDSSRGYHISGALIIDEAAWMADGDFEQIYVPMLQNFKSAKCLLISSPRGCNWFCNYYNKGKEQNGNYVSFKTTYEDNPFCDTKEIENFRQTMPDLIFRQEILAEFVSGASSAFGDRWKKCVSRAIHTQRKSGEKYFMGIDVGRQDDYTVATVISQISGEVVEILRIRQTTFEHIADEIVKLARKWNVSSILQEVNGIGDPFYELLEKKLTRAGITCLKPWTTTNTTKNNIVEALNIAFENGEIAIPDNPELKGELDVFEVEYSRKSHSVTYGARNGYHDDMILSLALANWSRRTAAMSGVYAIA